MKENLVIFDTTLRDGEQSPGVTLTQDEKIVIARQLSRLGVTVCEAGFPIASQGDFDSVKRIAEEVGPLVKGRKSEEPMVIAALARAKEGDIERAYEAIKGAPKHRIHTFLATSDIHLEYKLKITREQCLQQIKDAVSFAKSKCDDIEFSTEDAGRSDRDFLVKACATAIEAGATTLNIPDTVGYCTPEEYGDLFDYLIKNTPNSSSVTWSTHCHNDLGLATANTLSAVCKGARQVEVTINGIGERAGNTSLEEIVMALKTHSGFYPVETYIDTVQIMKTSKLVSDLSGMSVQSNKAIVGKNAFAHEAGIHQDGMLKNQSTYEIMKPESVGVFKSNLVLGKHSGRHAFKTRLEELGYDSINDEHLNKAFYRFKELCDTKKTVTDFDLNALVKDEITQPSEYWKLNTFQVTCGDKLKSTATVSVTDPEGKEILHASVGEGPINAVFNALQAIISIPTVLDSFTVNAITGGTDALGEVGVVLRPENNNVEDGEEGKKLYKNSGKTFAGHGTDPDIIVASARAYMSAINRLVSYQESHYNRRSSAVPIK
eukprot:Nk52_evm34s222 gene=Nk52_evmTU34s222